MAQRSIDILIRSRDQTARGLKSVGSGLERLKRLAFSVQGALGGIGVGLTATASLRAFAQQEKAEQLLATAVENRADLTADATERLKEQAAALQRVTILGDEQTLAIQRQAIAFGASEQQATRLALASANVAAVTGRDVQSSANQLIKTLGGYAGELGEVIPAIKTLTKEQLQAGAAIDLINEKFRGFAAREAATASGQLRQSLNALGDTSEIVGAKLASMFTGRQGDQQLSFLQSLTSSVNELNDALITLRNFRASQATGLDGGEAANPQLRINQRRRLFDAREQASSRGGFDILSIIRSGLDVAVQRSRGITTDAPSVASPRLEALREGRQAIDAARLASQTLELRNAQVNDALLQTIAALQQQARDSGVTLQERLAGAVGTFGSSVGDALASASGAVRTSVNETLRELSRQDAENRRREQQSNFRARLLALEAETHVESVLERMRKEAEPAKAIQFNRTGIAPVESRFLTRAPGAGLNPVVDKLTMQNQKADKANNFLGLIADDIDQIRQMGLGGNNQFVMMTAPAA